MKFEIEKNQFPMLNVDLEKGEKIKMESGAMVMHTNGIKLEGKTNGGVLKALSKSILGGENFFTTTAEALGEKESITLAPKGLGTIHHIKLEGTNWFLEDGVFLASSEGVEYNMKKQKGIGNALLGGTGGFFILKTEGQGDLFVESFGSIREIEIKEGEEITVDNDHVIGWEETVNHKIEFASGTFGFKTGEGLVIKLSGKGKVLIQSRQIEAFIQNLIPFMPQQR